MISCVAAHQSAHAAGVGEKLPYTACEVTASYVEAGGKPQIAIIRMGENGRTALSPRKMSSFIRVRTWSECCFWRAEHASSCASSKGGTLAALLPLWLRTAAFAEVWRAKL